MGGKKESGVRKPRPIQPASSPFYSLTSAVIQNNSSSTTHSFLLPVSIATTSLHNDQDAITFATLKKILHKPLADFVGPSSTTIGSHTPVEHDTSAAMELITDVLAVEPQVDTLRHVAGRPMCSVSVLVTVKSGFLCSYGVVVGTVESLPYRETARITIHESEGVVVLARCMESEPLSVGQSVLLSVSPTGLVCFRVVVGGSSARSTWRDTTSTFSLPDYDKRSGQATAAINWQPLQYRFSGRVEPTPKGTDFHDRADNDIVLLRPTRFAEKVDRRLIVPTAVALPGKRPRSDSDDEDAPVRTKKAVPPTPTAQNSSSTRRDDGGDSDADDDTPTTATTAAAKPKAVISVKRAVSKYHNAVPQFDSDGTMKGKKNLTKFEDDSD